MSDPRFLVVDDDRGNCATVKKILADHGYESDVAYDGPSALQLVDQKNYSLALLDYQMPGMDGVELYEHIRKRQPNLIGVFLTSFTTLDTVYPAISAGVERVLAKPVQKDELIAVIEELMSSAS